MLNILDWTYIWQYCALFLFQILQSRSWGTTHPGPEHPSLRLEPWPFCIRSCHSLAASKLWQPAYPVAPGTGKNTTNKQLPHCLRGGVDIIDWNRRKTLWSIKYWCTQHTRCTGPCATPDSESGVAHGAHCKLLSIVSGMTETMESTAIAILVRNMI